MVSFNAEYARLAALQNVGTTEVKPGKTNDKRSKGLFDTTSNVDNFSKATGKAHSFDSAVSNYIQEGIMSSFMEEIEKKSKKRGDIGDGPFNPMEEELNKEIEDLDNPNIKNLDDLQNQSYKQIMSNSRTPEEANKLITYKLIDTLAKAHKSSGSTNLAYMDEAQQLIDYLSQNFNPYVSASLSG